MTEVGALCYSVLPEVATLVYSLANSLNIKGFLDFFLHVYGVLGEIRTLDPVIKSHVLCQLSYEDILLLQQLLLNPAVYHSLDQGSLQ